VQVTTILTLGDDVATIQAILRHKSPNTTARYLKSLGHEDVRAALQSLSMKRDRAPPPQQGGVDGSDRAEKEKPSEEPSTPHTAWPKLRVVK
jgi:hypothetical protein